LARVIAVLNCGPFLYLSFLRALDAPLSVVLCVDAIQEFLRLFVSYARAERHSNRSKYVKNEDKDVNGGHKRYGRDRHVLQDAPVKDFPTIEGPYREQVEGG
jgi:hypothetical protein